MGSAMLNAFLYRLLLGTIPFISGILKKKSGYGKEGAIACIISSLILEIVFTVPICAIYVYRIIRKENPPQGDSSGKHTGNILKSYSSWLIDNWPKVGVIVSIFFDRLSDCDCPA